MVSFCSSALVSPVQLPVNLIDYACSCANLDREELVGCEAGFEGQQLCQRFRHVLGASGMQHSIRNRRLPCICVSWQPIQHFVIPTCIIWFQRLCYQHCGCCSEALPHAWHDKSMHVLCRWLLTIREEGPSGLWVATSYSSQHNSIVSIVGLAWPSSSCYFQLLV